MKVIFFKWNTETDEYDRAANEQFVAGLDQFIFNARHKDKYRKIDGVHVFSNEVHIYYDKDES